MRRELTRRTFLGGSAAAGTGLLLAACGQVATAPAEGEAPAAKEEAKPAEQPKPAEQKTVRYLHYTTTQAVWDESFGGLFDTFRAQNPDVNLEVDPVTGGFSVLIEKAVASFAGGIVFDVYYGHFSYISQFATAEMIQTLEPFLSADAEVSKDDYHVWATERIQGQVYSIAWFTNGKEYWYNADLYVEAGLKTPKEHEAEGTWTWETALEGAKKLTKVEGNNVTQWGFVHALLLIRLALDPPDGVGRDMVERRLFCAGHAYAGVCRGHAVCRGLGDQAPRDAESQRPE